MTLSALPFPMPFWLPSGSGGPIYHQWNWVHPRDWNVSNPSAAQTLDGALLQMTSRLQFVRPWIVVGKRIQILIKNRGRPKIWHCLIISSTWLVHQQGHLWSLWNGLGCASKKPFLVVRPWWWKANIGYGTCPVEKHAKCPVPRNELLLGQTAWTLQGRTWIGLVILASCCWYPLSTTHRQF